MSNFFSNLLLYLQKDWRENKLRFIIEMIGTMSSITSTITLAVMLEGANLYVVYLLWLVGSFTLTITSYMRGASWMVCLMAIYSITNVIGLLHLLGSH